MKKLFILSLFSTLCIFAKSQENTLSKKEEQKIIKEIASSNFIVKSAANNSCECISKIEQTGKSSDAITKEISACIDSQVLPYQLMKTIMGNASAKSGKDKKVLYLDNNLNSKSAKEAYNEIERYLMDSCESIKVMAASDNTERENSVTKNNQAQFNYNRGYELFSDGNYSEAIKYYKLAIEIDPKFVFAYDNLGLAYRKNNQLDEAIAAYEKSVELDPKGTMPLQNLAIAYLYKKDYDNSAKMYERLAKVSPGNPEVYYGLGQLYAINLNDIEKGLENICIAHNIYVEQKSPYRTDAEKMIGYIYAIMKQNKNEKKFKEILKKHNISPNFSK